MTDVASGERTSGERTSGEVTWRRTIRDVFTLSFASLVARVVTAAGQSLLIVWLTPEEFGFWASAVSALALVAGLTNLGEVNAYLARPGSSLAGLKRRTRRSNAVLTLFAVAVCGAYLAAGQFEVGLLGFFVAASIPLQGEADVLYAAYLREDEARRLALAQIVASILKTLGGIVVAAWTGSGVALGISLVLYPVVVIIALSRRRLSDAQGGTEDGVSVSTRAEWAVNTWSQTIPTQIALIVAQFLAEPAVVGVFYFAYQLTVNISGLLSVPIARSVLAAISGLGNRQRRALADRLIPLFSAGLGLICGLAAVTLMLVADRVGGEWAVALPVTIGLLGSLPARITNPMMDAMLQAGGRWRLSSGINFLDAAGTAAASLSALTGDVLILGAAVSAWKTAFASVRCLLFLWPSSRIRAIGTSLALVGFGLSLCLFGLQMDANAVGASIGAGSTVLLLFGLAIFQPREEKHSGSLELR